MRWVFRVGISLALGLALAGCAGMVGAWPGALLALLMVLGLAACTDPAANTQGTAAGSDTVQQDTAGDDVAEQADTGEPNDVAPTPDTEGPTDVAEPACEDDGGTWAECCVDQVVTQCCCPEGMACNFFFDYCDDGTCAVEGLDQCPVDEDVTTPDVADTRDVEEPSDIDDKPDTGCDGNWETCCIDGDIGQCCCPEGAACNFGWFDACQDGSCADFGQCPEDADVGEPDVSEPDVSEPDVSEPDAGEPEKCDGYWEPCCVANEVSECCCPAGAACNFGWFNNCGDGTCTFIGEECPEKF